MTDCPSALSARETRLLQHYAHQRRVVEAGALLGYSTIMLARVAARVVSIDKHEGYTTPTLRRYMTNLERASVLPRVTPIVGDAIELLPRHAADLAFIDLTGERELTLAALLAVRAPIVGVHDVTRSRCRGVCDAIRIAGYSSLAHVDTLAILRKPL